MKSQPRLSLAIFGLVSLLVIFLAGCTAEPSATPTVTSVPPTNTSTPKPTATPTQTPTPEPTFTPTSSPTWTPWPTQTATPRGTATPAGFYTNPGRNYSLILPSEWELAEENDVLTVFSHPTDPIQLILVAAPKSDEITAAILVDIYAGYTPGVTDTMTTEPATFQDTIPAELSRASLPIDGVPEDVILETWTIHRVAMDYFFTLLGFGSTLAEKQFTTERILNSIELLDTLVYGLERDTTFVELGGRPENLNLDPVQEAANASGYAGMLFRGLVRFDENLQIQPDLAESWVASPDGSVYTFTLREGITFQNGKPITAYDFLYSWERAADPDTNSPTAKTYLGDILGVDEKLSGDADTIAGLKVLDSQHLQVALEAPVPYFLLKLTYSVAFVVDADNIKKEGSDWPFSPNASGPFILEEYIEDDALIFVRNPAYHSPAKIAHSVNLIFRAGTSISYYKAGEIDITGLSSLDALQILENPDDPLNKELASNVAMCTSYLSFNNTRPPMDDLNVRKAFALSINKALLNERFSEGMDVEATTLLPPAMPGYQQGAVQEGFSVDAARAALAASAYKDGLPQIVLETAGYGGGNPYQDTIISMLQEALGVDVVVEYVDPDDVSRALRNNNGHIVMFGWCADYPDPENFLDVLFHSEGEFNIGNYSNPALDALLETARITMDPTERLGLYHQAEIMLLEDYAFLPMDHGTSYYLVKPYIKGVPNTPFNIPVMDWIEIEKTDTE